MEIGCSETYTVSCTCIPIDQVFLTQLLVMSCIKTVKQPSKGSQRVRQNYLFGEDLPSAGKIDPFFYNKEDN